MTAPAGRDISALVGETFDCLVIGGGITGAGIARETARRGLRVALVEREDFASGTSSRSTKLIHGGLRYLAMGDFLLVAETARERKHVHAMAPHLAEPRWLVVPARTRVGLAKLRAGITLFEKLGGVARADRHRNWHEAELAATVPQLDVSRYPHACVYREYVTDDARLVVANVRDAAHHGAVVANYVAVVGLRDAAPGRKAVLCRCARTGREFDVRAHAVVNAAGPWVEDLCELDEGGRVDKRPPLQLSKGIHVVFPRRLLPLDHMALLTTRDRRMIFAIPRGDVVYIGTTDTSHGGEAALWPDIGIDDVRYLLQPLPRYFPEVEVDPEDCIAGWAGLRTLVAEPGKQSKEVSRREEIWTSSSGLITIAGGKLTGFRLMANEAAAAVAKVLAAKVGAAAISPLPGGDFAGDLDQLSSALGREMGLPAETTARLVRLYGADAADAVRASCQPLVAGSTVLEGEVDWAVKREFAVTLEDVVYRRTRAALYHSEREALARAACERMKGLCGWTDEEAGRQLDHTMGLLANDLGFRAAGGRDR